MKATTFSIRTTAAFTLASSMALALGACSGEVEPPAPTPAPTPAPVAAPKIAPVPVPPLPVVTEPVYENYLDAPQSPGTWAYSVDPGETLATYGVARDIAFILRCDRTTGKIGMGRVVTSANSAPRVLSISTETTTNQLQARPVSQQPPIVAVELDPRDPLLDAMAITKGRFAVGVEGERTLYLPAWTEVTRVIEDCR